MIDFDPDCNSPSRSGRAHPPSPYLILMRPTPWLILLLATWLLAGCGKKGPLYLPERAAPASHATGHAPLP